MTSLAGAAALAYARYVEPYRVFVRQIDVALPSLQEELDGLSIGFMSDLHLGGPNGGFQVARAAIEVLAQRRPDLILLGGDYYDRGHCRDELFDWKKIRDIAPVWAVLGNHDHNRGVAETSRIIAELEGAGINMLRNTSTELMHRGQRICIIGVDDPYSNRARFSEAADTNTRPGTFRVLLTHAGMIADELLPGDVDLILSGHTHGAQIRISPFAHSGPLDLFWWLDRWKGNRLSPYRQGMFRVSGNLLYVGNGVGTTSLGLRFLAPPEVAIITLRRHAGREDYPCDSVDRYVLKNNFNW